MSSSHNTTTITVALIIVTVSASVFLVPIPTSTLVKDPFVIRLYISLLLAAAFFNVQAAVLFWHGLNGFKEELQRTYKALCAALTLLSVAMIQAPVAGLIGAMWWLNLGIFNILYAVAAFLLFMASRAFVHSLGIRTRTASLPVTMLLVLMTVSASVFIPAHLSSFLPNIVGLRASLAGLSVNVVLIGLAVANIRLVTAKIGTVYTRAMRWLLIAVVGFFVVQLQAFILQVIGLDNWLSASGWSNVLSVVNALMFVWAGYAFWDIGSIRKVEHTSPIDVIVYAASLATNADAIDNILDRLRTITAQLEPGQTTLSSQDQVELSNVYLGLEDYLVHKEQLRTFTRDSLRERIHGTFPHHEETDTVFWRRLE